MSASRGRRVALITSSFYPHFGGVEEHVRHVARELHAQGMHVEVWTVDRGAGIDVSEVDGVLVRYLPTPLPARDPRAFVRFLLACPRALSAWAAAHRRCRPDLLHVHCFGPNGIYSLVVQKLFGTPLILSSHGETFMDAQDVFARSAQLRAALRHACRASATVTAVSSVVVEDLRARFGADEVKIVPNGVDHASSVGPVDGAIGCRAPVLVSAGRMVRNKGFDLLLRALASCRSRPRLLLVGDGPERAALQALAAELGVAKDVDFVGRRSSRDVREFMALADAVVVPSRIEAFGIVVLEAWASGTALLATRRGGPAQIVTDRVDGLLFDPEDIGQTAALIDEILGDPCLASRLASAGRQTVTSYTWAAVAARYSEIYDEVLGMPDSRRSWRRNQTLRA